jgi:hypothetical protein
MISIKQQFALGQIENHTVRPVVKFNRKIVIVETREIDFPNTHINDRSISLFGTLALQLKVEQVTFW